MNEELILKDSKILVTTNQITIGATTYPTRNITSVKATYQEPSLGCAILCLLGALFVLLITGIWIYIGIQEKEEVPAQVYLTAVGSLVVLVASIFWMRSQKRTYHITLETSAGSAQVLSSQNESYIDNVTAAIRKAITS